MAVALPFFDAIRGTTSRLGKTYKKETAIAVLALCRRARMDVVVLPTKKVMVIEGKLDQ